MINTSNLSHVENVCSAVPDDEAAGRLVARHFCELGYLHAGYPAARIVALGTYVPPDTVLTEFGNHGQIDRPPVRPDHGGDIRDDARHARLEGTGDVPP